MQCKNLAGCFGLLALCMLISSATAQRPTFITFDPPGSIQSADSVAGCTDRCDSFRISCKSQQNV